jgi:two-component sensor histidine kinase/CheY-like chemotaxis protein
MRILIVDDNKESLYILEALLKGGGYEVVSAGNGAEALEKLSTKSVDMIISDVLMPVMDGFKFCKEVREQDELKNIPFIFYTATYKDEREEKLASKLGADKYILKPAEPEELIKIIQGMLRDVEEGKFEPMKPALEEKEEVMKLYNERLINKLEKKMLELEREVAERKRAEDQIKASLREKEVLLQEVHHRVKNNMQIISSLFSLQSRHIKDKRALEIFKSSQNRVRSMALIHERFYQSEDMAKVDFAEYAQSLTSHLFSSHGIKPGAVKLNLKIKDVFLDLNTAIPCGLIINELVSNSLKHAFPGENNGEIKIAMHPLNKDGMEVIVSDNGVGLPKKVDFRKTDSLGLHLVNLLAEDQLHGNIKLDRTKGTSFHIRFKMKR